MDALLCHYSCPAGQALHSLRVPEGLPELVFDISREVLRKQPPNLCAFIADYLESLVATQEASRAMRDMMTAFFAELGGGETALSGTGPGGELDLQELTTDGHRPPWTPTSEPPQQGLAEHSPGLAALAAELPERASPPSEPQPPAECRTCSPQWPDLADPGDVSLGVPLLGASLGVSLGALLGVPRPGPAAVVDSAHSAHRGLVPQLTVTSAEGTTLPWTDSWQGDTAPTQSEPKLRSALTKRPASASSSSGRDPVTLQQLLEPRGQCLEKATSAPVAELPLLSATAFCDGAGPALGSTLQPARAFEKEGAVPKIRPHSAPRESRDCSRAVPEPGGLAREREPLLLDLDDEELREMEMMGAQISSLLAMSPLDPLVPVLCEAMTDTSDLQDLLLSDSDSDDTLVGSPPGSPVYSVTFPTSPLEGLAERLVALPEAADDVAEVAEGTDVCFHDGSVLFELDDRDGRDSQRSSSGALSIKNVVQTQQMVVPVEHGQNIPLISGTAVQTVNGSVSYGVASTLDQSTCPAVDLDDSHCTELPARQVQLAERFHE